MRIQTISTVMKMFGNVRSCQVNGTITENLVQLQFYKYFINFSGNFPKYISRLSIKNFIVTIKGKHSQEVNNENTFPRKKSIFFYIYIKDRVFYICVFAKNIVRVFYYLLYAKENFDFSRKTIIFSKYLSNFLSLQKICKLNPLTFHFDVSLIIFIDTLKILNRTLDELHHISVKIRK